jgi:putative transposase
VDRLEHLSLSSQGLIAWFARKRKRKRITEATLYNWKAKYGGMDVSDSKRLKAPEDRKAEEAARRPDPGGGGAEGVPVNGKARRQVRSRCASAGRHGSFGTAGLFHRRRRSEDGALPILPAA